MSYNRSPLTASSQDDEQSSSEASVGLPGLRSDTPDDSARMHELLEGGPRSFAPSLPPRADATMVVLPSTREPKASLAPAQPPREDRRAIRAEAVVTTPTGQRFSFQTVSISVRGFFLSASTRQVPIAMGSVCSVELRSKERRVRLRAELVHLGDGNEGRREGYGFRITMLTREQQSQLEQLIESAPSQQGGTSSGGGSFAARASGRAAFLAAGVAAASAIVALVAYVAQGSRTVLEVSAAHGAEMAETLTSGAGEIAAKRVSTVRSPAAAPAAFSTVVEPGAVVRTGDLIAIVVDRSLDPARLALEAKLTAAEARARELLVKNGDAAGIAEAAGAVAKARAEVSAKGIDRQRRHAVAPFDGVVVEVLARQGELVAPAAPLVEMMDTSQLRANVPFREGDAARISTGMRATLRLPGSGPVEGVVDGLGLVARPFGDVRKAVLVEVTLPADIRVRPGTTARAEVQLPTRSVLVVPSSSVWRENERSYVWVLPGRSGDLDVKLVETGAVVGGDTEIVHGLSQGSVVLTHGELPGLRRGMHVTAR